MTRWAGFGADILLTLFCAVLIVLTAHRLADEGRAWTLDAITGVAMCVVAAARHRYPLGAPVAALAVSGTAAVVAMTAGLPGEPGAAAIVALMVVGCTAVRVLPPRTAVAVELLGLAVVGSGWVGAMLGWQTSHTAYTVGSEGWLMAVALGFWLRHVDRRRRNAAESVRRDERLTLARELHDVVAHHVTGIVLQTQAARIAARRRGDGDGVDDLDDTLAEVEAAGGEALAAMRRVVGLLRDTDDALPTGTGPERLAELVGRFDGHGPAVTLSLPEEEETRWPPEVASTVYRVVQESLTNVARHAGHARSACVEVSRCPTGITVVVDNDAPSGTQRHLHRDGFGLVGMRERVEALGGTLNAGPKPAGGWAVTATLPVSVPAPGERR